MKRRTTARTSQRHSITSSAPNDDWRGQKVEVPLYSPQVPSPAPGHPPAVAGLTDFDEHFVAAETNRFPDERLVAPHARPRGVQ